MTVSVFLQLSTVSRVQMFRLHELARPVTSEEGGGGGARGPRFDTQYPS